jgi:hypothetical protein
MQDRPLLAAHLRGPHACLAAAPQLHVLKRFRHSKYSVRQVPARLAQGFVADGVLFGRRWGVEATLLPVYQSCLCRPACGLLVAVPNAS